MGEVIRRDMTKLELIGDMNLDKRVEFDDLGRRLVGSWGIFHSLS